MSVEYCEADGDFTWRETTLTARAPKKCGACGETIRRLDRYVRDYQNYEGSVSEVLRCARCEVLYRELVARHEKRAEKTGEEHIIPARDLSCGHTFEYVFGKAPPKALAELAFLTADEAQRRLEKSK